MTLMYLVYLDMKGGGYETGDDEVEANEDIQMNRSEVHVIEEYTAEPRSDRVLTISLFKGFRLIRRIMMYYYKKIGNIN